MEIYRITFNSDSVKKINCYKMYRSDVHRFVNIDEELLIEKDSWYIVDGKVSFFRARNDSRLYGELFSCEFFRKAGNETTNYDLVYLNNELGLLTQNFQDIERYSYYDFTNFTQMFGWFIPGSKSLTFKEILETISSQFLPNGQELIQGLIDRYVGDWITGQLDGNVRNTLFMKNNMTGEISLAPIFDREKSFGLNRFNEFSDEGARKIWIPSIPYEDPDFKSHPECFMGYDANIFSLALDYPEETEKSIKKYLLVDSKEVINSVDSRFKQFRVQENTFNFLTGFLDERKESAKQLILERGRI